MELFEVKPSDFRSPEELLALEEALLEHCESNDHPGFLHFWEAAQHFVVLGYSKHLKEEVFEKNCSELGIPILRRASGGGTVLQGPGCFNYTLVLPLDAAPETETITGANCYIMRKIRDAIAPLTDFDMCVRGHTDVTLNGLKFSGNAQRRKRRCLLFHGSFLLSFDLALIGKTLRMPRQQPEYRENREHKDFLTNAGLDPKMVRTALIESWGATAITSVQNADQIRIVSGNLVATKYSQDEWNRRW